MFAIICKYIVQFCDYANKMQNNSCIVDILYKYVA